MGKLLWRCCIIGLWLFALTGVSKSDEIHTLKIALNTQAGPFDMAVAPTIEQTVVVRSVYETLVRRSLPEDAGHSKYVPQLARSWTVSDDGKIWTFEIEKGHFFDDGHPVTANAVVFSINRVMALGRGPASRFEDIIKKVEALDDYKVRFWLKVPSVVFLPRLADVAASVINPDVMKNAVNGDFASRWLSQHTAGSGPFRLQPLNQKGIYILERNPFSSKKTYFSKVIYQEILDSTVRRLALEKGQVDVAFGLPPQALPGLERDPNISVYTHKTVAFINIALNTETGVMQDRRLRKAVAYALDYDGIIKYIKDNRAIPFRGPIPEGMPGSSPVYYPAEQNLNKAIRLAHEAGIRDGTSISLVYPGVSSETDTLVQYIQSVLRPLGLQVRLQRLTIPAFLDRVQRGAYDAVLMGWVASFDDPAAIVNYWYNPNDIGSAGNLARYQNPELFNLVKRSNVEQNPEKRAKLLNQVARMSVQDMPYIHLYQVKLSVAMRSDIGGYMFDPVEAIVLPISDMWRVETK